MTKTYRARFVSAIYYDLIRRSIKVLPLRRYTAAGKLMGMAKGKLRMAIVNTARGKWLIIPDTPSTWLFPFGLKEPAVQQQLEMLFQDADAFIDCGANLGWYSFLASRVPSLHRIVAVEPIHQSVRYLEYIKKLNQIAALEVIEGCVSDHDGKVNFSMKPEAFSELGHVTEGTPDENSHKVLSSQSYTLESILQRVDQSLNRVCVKVDVEGHEGAVLRSISAETLSTRIQSIIVEVHLFKFSHPEQELETICQHLSAVGTLSFLVLSPRVQPGYQDFGHISPNDIPSLISL